MLEDKRNRVDEEFVRQVYGNAYQTHLKYAPAAARNAWNQHVDAVVRRDFQEARKVGRPVEECAHECLLELCEALGNISPVGALELLLGERPDRLYEYQLPKGAEFISLDRGAWLIGVFGNGHDSTRYGALKVFNKYVRWVAASLIDTHIKSVSSVNDADRILTQTAGQLKTSRLVEPETRMMWVTAEITDEIGKWADTNADQLSTPGMLTSEVAAQINYNVSKATTTLDEAYRNKQRPMPTSFSEMLLDGLPESLVKGLTSSHRPITAHDVEKALTSDAPTIFPFVKIRDKTRVLSRSSWMRRRDDALFRTAMQESPRETEGKVFEDVTTALLQKWGPTGISWQSSVNLVSPQSSKNADDIDVLGFSENTTFIGECKANRLSENNSSVGANFDEKVLTKATSQLEIRTEHWNCGWRPQLHGQAFADDLMGFITTFSSYGGLLWNPNAVRNGEQSVHFGIFPLYSLILAASTLKSPTDLKNYFSYRLDLITKGVKASDELEYILGFHSAQTEVPHEEQNGAVVLFRQYELNDQGIWIDPRKYHNRKDWKDKFVRQLWTHTTPVTPSLT